MAAPDQQLTTNGGSSRSLAWVLAGIAALSLIACSSDATRETGTKPTDGSSTQPTAITIGEPVRRTPIPTATPAPRFEVAPGDVAFGGEFAVTVVCPGRPDRWGEIAFIDSESGDRLGDLIRVLPSTDPSRPQPWYEATVRLPYFVSPGRLRLENYCPQPEEGPQIESSVQIRVLDPPAGRWDSWRPIDAPRLAAAADTSALNVSVDGDVTEVQAVGGDRVPVEALCGADIEVGGARFIVWGRTTSGPEERSDAFFAVEYPAADYQATDAGVVVSAELVVDESDFPDLGLVIDGPVLSVLCESTDPSFEPDAEVQPESATFRLWVDVE